MEWHNTNGIVFLYRDLLKNTIKSPERKHYKGKHPSHYSTKMTKFEIQTGCKNNCLRTDPMQGYSMEYSFLQFPFCIIWNASHNEMH